MRAAWWLLACSSLGLLSGCAQLIGIEDADLGAAGASAAQGGAAGASAGHGSGGEGGAAGAGEAGAAGAGEAGAAGEPGGSGPGGREGGGGGEAGEAGEAGEGGAAGAAGNGTTGEGGAAGEAGAGGEAGAAGDAGAGKAGASGEAGTAGAAGKAGAAGEAGASQGGAAGSGVAGQAGAAGQGASGAAGAGPACVVPEDCPGSDSECKSRVCAEGVCGWSLVAKGTALPQQAAGDCKKAVCDGQGAVVQEDDDADLPVAASCLVGVCAAGMPKTGMAQAGSGCDEPGGKLCDGKGTCVECLVGADCASGLCDGGACLAASCFDGVKNGSESDKDCGGSCGKCAQGKVCQAADDCQSSVCGAGVCQAATCSDLAKNGDETDIDCGGSCGKCLVNKACKAAQDCSSGVCAGGKCQAPSCTDGVKNGSELDTDCGGACGKCEVGQLCTGAADCATDLCLGGVCKAPACDDKLKDGTESDVDCGGSCGGCALGGACNVGADCASKACVGGVCQAYIVGIGGASEVTCAIHGGGQLKCWGRNQFGSLGQGDGQSRGAQPGEMGDALPPVDLGPGAVVRSVSRGLNYSICAILESGALKCWGRNNRGQLGLGDTAHRGDDPGEMGAKLPAVNLGAGRTAKAVAVGVEHACAILDDGKVKCWGNGEMGRLGLGDGQSRGDQPGEMGDALPPVDLGSGRTAKAISAGFAHTCVILDDDSVKCWGYGADGQLFNGKSADLGDNPGEMGDALPAVNLGAGRTARGIALAYVHTCLVLDDGKVKCNGNNTNGRLGLGDVASHQGQTGDALPAVDLGQGALDIVTGANHACAVLNDGSLRCWGENPGGQLGLGDKVFRGDQPGGMGAGLPAVALGAGLKATRIFAGAFHSCALFGDARLKCWGENSSGALGLGDANDRGDQPGEMGDALPFVGF